MSKRTCRVCLVEKPISAFREAPGKPSADGSRRVYYRRRVCRGCEAEATGVRWKRWRAENPKAGRPVQPSLFEAKS